MRLPFVRWLYLQLAMRAILPFSRWVDYCDLAMIVPASSASTRLEEVITQLERIPAKTLKSKAAAARRLRDVFDFSPAPPDGSASQLTRVRGAVDFLLAELCDMARNVPPNVGAPPNASVRLRQIMQQATRLERCAVLLSPLEAR